jgi:hypothetical protein
MSFIIQTVGTSPGANSGSCVIVAPTGIVLGDILIAHINFYGGGSGVTAPAGWTEIAKPVLGGGIMYAGYKIATATEVAAVDFTFTSSGGTATANLGKITRINGGRESNIGYAKANASSGGGTGTAITVGTITPSVANSLILFLVGGGDQQTTYSAFAMVTSNPTWTVAYGSVFNGTIDTGIAMAYAIRPETTATGNNTATQSFNVFWAGQVIAIEPQIETVIAETVTPTDAVLMGMSTVVTETITGTDTANAEGQDWVNTDKSSSTWVNQIKS